MAWGRGESNISRNERGPEFLGKCDVRSLIGRKIVTELPDAGQVSEEASQLRQTHPGQSSRLALFSN
jgi:hypothetical protein